MRRFLFLLVAAVLLPPIVHYDPPRAPNDSQQVTVVRLWPAAADTRPRRIGPFDLVDVWRLTSANDRFYGLSALLAKDGRLTAISDKSIAVHFAEPHEAGTEPMRLTGLRIGPTAEDSRDSEGATVDPRTGTIWVSFEWSNAIVRYTPALDTITGQARPPQMHGWPENRGPEAMARLSDGRFLVLGEVRLTGPRHPAVLFDADPVAGGQGHSFSFVGPDGFRPTDIAQLPDGRVLILSRSLLWPFPPRFGAMLSLADPAEIRPGGEWISRDLARLPGNLPVDNMEGLAIEPRPDGKLSVWLVSDDNGALTQQTVLWQLELDPKRLPPAAHTQKASPQARLR